MISAHSLRRLAMKRLAWWIIDLAIVSGAPLLAQSMTGTWQGTLQVDGKELRTVIKVSTMQANNLPAVMYSIDQGGQGTPATVILKGFTVKIAVPGIGATYEGKLNADGNSIAGTWIQPPAAPLPLILTRASIETAWAIPNPPAQPMAADANPSFEVGTIKPSRPEEQLSILGRGRQFVTTATSLSDLITYAYGLHARQIIGGPAWVEAEKYDLLAQPDVDGRPNSQQLRMMVQKFLADRFKLIVHRDKKELSVYAVVIAKAGAKLTGSTGDPNGGAGVGFRARGAMTVKNATIADLAGLMQRYVLDRPVVDQTGISGRYDLSLNWTPDESQFGDRAGQLPPPPGDVEAPDLYTAFEQQLGLKLESTKAPAEILVIDHVERPAEN